MLDILLLPQTWGAIITLTFLEIVLGIDNIIFISIITNKLPEEKRASARSTGLILALALRIIMLFGITVIISLTSHILSYQSEYLRFDLSGQSIILLLGGIFLLYKSTIELHEKTKTGKDSEKSQLRHSPSKNSFYKTIIQIALIDIVFAFDSILTAVGMTNGMQGALFIMIFSVIVSIIIMILFSGQVANFINNQPSIQIIGLAFLLLIGFMLITEAAHISGLSIFGSEVGAVPKGYLYFAISFSLLVEFLNSRSRK